MDKASSAIAEDAPSEGEPPDEPPEKHSSVFGKIPSLLKSSFASKSSKKIESEAKEPEVSETATPKASASLKFLSSISLDFSGHFSSLRRKSTIVQEDSSPPVQAKTQEPAPTAPIPCSKPIETKNAGSNASSLDESSVRSTAACSKSYEASFKFLSSISLADEGERARMEENERRARTLSTTIAKQDSADSEADTLTDNTLLADRFTCDSPNEHDRASSSLAAAAGSEAQRKKLLATPTPLDIPNRLVPSSTGTVPSPSLDSKQQQQSLDFLKSIAFAPSPSTQAPLSGPPGPLSTSSATHVPSHLSWTRRELFGASLGSLEQVFSGDGSVSAHGRKLPGHVLVRDKEGRWHRTNSSALGVRNSTPEETMREEDEEAAGAQEEREGEGAVGWSPVCAGGEQGQVQVAVTGSQGTVGSASSGREEAPVRAVHTAVKAEGGLGATHLQDSTLYMCPRGPRGPRPPMAIFSVIKHRPEEAGGDASEVVHSVGTQRLVREGSYAGLLSRVGNGNGESGWDKEKGGGGKIPMRYDPLFLDDPEIRIAKDRTVIKQEGYMVSCIPFVKPKLMKEELNQLFLAKHGDWLEGSDMTLSKIRSLKATIVEVVVAVDVELATAALAHVLLEKLILSNLVKKSTRKVTAAVCLLLAFKMNEVPRCPAIEAIQQGLERQQPSDASLFVACSDPSGAPRPLPADLIKFVDHLRGRKHEYEGMPDSHPSRAGHVRHYLLASFADRSAAEAARLKINSHFFGPQKRLRAVADFLPDLKGCRGGGAEGKGGKGGRMCSVSDLLLEMQAKLGVDRQAVLTQEFPTFVDLEMGLHVEAEELLPHLHRILASLDLSPSAYLGQDSASLAEAESCSLQAAAAAACEEEDDDED